MEFEQVKQAFALWETDYRTNSRDFQTAPEMWATPEDELAHGRADYFLRVMDDLKNAS